MKKLIFQLIISSILINNSSFLLFGQEEIIHGNVTTYETIPLSGASIKVKSTKKVVFSDTLGRFAVLCLPKDKLKVSARGFSNQNVKINEKTKHIFVNLTLKPGPENRELAVGYGYVKDSDKLDAMSSLNEKDTEFSHYSNIYEIIRGRFSGVQIINDEIIIRGDPSLVTNYAALLVVDDVVVDKSMFRSIPTADVASINILKGSDAAIYGSMGAGGVVIVETKTGKNQ
jgi:TonB-dependent SusC/RagA subfamily outer membrane receptor